ncbi:preprotein translocase subunit SecA [Candidatus Profftella armatura]
MSFLTKIFGSRNQRLLKKYQKIVQKINELESVMQKLSDEELQNQTSKLKQSIHSGETLDSILPKAFSVCREASKRILKMRHFDVQLIGGIALHYGNISEMQTGEGKTLVATLAAYLNSLSGQGVHIVTISDYLAKRDAEWMSVLYNWLGLSIGVNSSEISHSLKKKSYEADITYGTNNEFGFDYLRDNMVFNSNDRVQRKLNFVILDEIDSILIDEARTPLIISGEIKNNAQYFYKIINPIPKLLVPEIDTKNIKKNIKYTKKNTGDYIIDYETNQVFLTENGYEKYENILIKMGLLNKNKSLYDSKNSFLIYHIYAALRAHVLYHKNKHYIIKNNKIIIVDEFTGRLMKTRRWAEGLHQALEAKENLEIQNETQTLASITFQNYFRMYKKISGMTGTAETEAYEFQEIYKLETITVPPNKINKRKDLQDKIYKTMEEKYQAILMDIKNCYIKEQPVLVGTTSIENSELLSNILKKNNLPHSVLNAKQHKLEAQIIAQAGHPKMITIATNMAGRGTDIILGGNIDSYIKDIKKNISSEVKKKNKIKKLKNEWMLLHDKVISSGGLHIIGTERHESRRIDNQLRGRSGRQGDPGSSRFYLSLDDSLLKFFSSDQIKIVMEKLKIPKGKSIESNLASYSIESAQRKIELRNFDIRKQLLEYDDIYNNQRKIICQERNKLLESKNISEIIKILRYDVLIILFSKYISLKKSDKEWDIIGLELILKKEFKLDISFKIFFKKKYTIKDFFIKILYTFDKKYENKIKILNNKKFLNFERNIILQSIDKYWIEHLLSLDQLRQGINLRSYAQKDPKREYKREAFKLFHKMLNLIKYEAIKKIMTIL